MPPPLLHLQDISLGLGGRPLLDGASLAVAAGERVCLVGRNGSGKSTLLRIASGEVVPDRGSRFVQPGIVMRVLPQEPDLSGHATTLEYAADGLDEVERYRAAALLHELGLTGAENTGRLSGGEARRAALARALAPSPDVLLLDEPTNHLDMPAIAWLEKELATLRSAIVLISHDRRLLETVTRSVVWLDRGSTRRLEAGFARFEGWREEVLENEERDAHKLDRQIAREEDWIRYGVTARRKRNVRRVAELAALRQARREAVRAPGVVQGLEASGAGVSGKLVAVAEGLGRHFDGRWVVSGLDLRLLRGDRLGIVGANGAGKTTILRLLTGADRADAGEVRLGTGLAVVTLDQQRRALRDEVTLADTLTGGGGDTVLVGEEKRHVIGYMKEFLFRPEQARTPVGMLSGGERGRLLLAKAMATPSNLLVLDEPTNDLDLETLDLLQEMLGSYPGTVLLVSHDRDFLDRVATSVLAAAGDGRWIEYAGGYSDMLAQGGGLGGGAAADRFDGVSAETPTAGKAVAERGPGRNKLSFRDKHALERLPGTIAEHEARIAALRAVLADPDLYRRDPKRFSGTTDALEREEAALSAAEERWLELEVLRETVESG